ncbi:MAG: TIM barrel protein [Planctomycetota bacterium]|nr:TIM barrel protein [Planctomycetota bacterium]MDG2142885.1 TIM barrel protein [Planctomycetota bacterium]
MATPSIPNNYTLSTTCFGDRLGKIEDQVFAGAAMGFRHFELGLSPAPVTMDGLCESRSETESTLVSMVAGCRDKRTGDMVIWKLASEDEGERERALNSMRRHLRLAEAWQCPRIIVRGTRIGDRDLGDRSDELEARVLREGLGEDGVDSPIAKEIQAMAKEVHAKGQRQLEHLCRGLHTLSKEMPELTFCIEPGKHLDDLLNIEAMGWLLDDLPSLMYWHDVGRVQMRECQGLPAQGDWLDRFGNRMAGIHLHDATATKNELPIGLGEVDFKLVAEYTPKGAAHVLEIEASHGRAEILSSVQALINLGF